MYKWDKHKLDCTCTYCKDSSTIKRLHYGLNIPEHWSCWNSWYVIKYWPGRYFRWTNSWLGWFSPSHRRWLKQRSAIQDAWAAEHKAFQKLQLSSEDISGLAAECREHEIVSQQQAEPMPGYLYTPYIPVFRTVMVGGKARNGQKFGPIEISCEDLLKSHSESLEDAGYQSEPNALTIETIEKAERGEDVKSFDTVEELFEDLNNGEED